MAAILGIMDLVRSENLDGYTDVKVLIYRYKSEEFIFFNKSIKGFLIQEYENRNIRRNIKVLKYFCVW